MFNSIIQALPYVRNRRLNALAITTVQRSALIPELPTIAESGLAGYEFYSWYGMMVPAGTSSSIVDRLYAEVVSVLDRSDFRQLLAKDGSEPVGSTPEQFAMYLAAEMAKWQKVTRATGMRVD